MGHLSKGTWRNCVLLMESSGIKPVAARQTINSTDSMHYAWFNRTFTLKIKAITVAQSLLATFWGLSSKTLIRNVSAELIKRPIQHLSTSTNICTSGCIRTIWTDNLPWPAFWGFVRAYLNIWMRFMHFTQFSFHVTVFFTPSPWNWSVSFLVCVWLPTARQMTLLFVQQNGLSLW